MLRLGWRFGFNQHLRLGHKEPIVEKDYSRQTAEQLTVWNESHAPPAGGAEFERDLLQWWKADADRQLRAARPKDRKTLRQYRGIVGEAIDILIGRGLADARQLEFDQLHKTDRGNHLQISGVLRHKGFGEALPIVFLYPKTWNKHAVLWLSREGKGGLFAGGGQLKREVAKLLAEGCTVAGVDLLYQGEFLTSGPIRKTRRVKNDREFAGYSFGYNPTLFVRRVHDVLTVLSYIRNHEYTPDTVSLVALDGLGPCAVAARAQARDAVTRMAVDTGGFRFAGVRDLHSPDFMPGGAKYDDLAGMLTVSAPLPLWIAGEKQLPSVTAAAYAVGNHGPQAVTYTGPQDKREAEAVRWLLKQ